MPTGRIKSDSRPLYIQAQERILANVLDGTYAPGLQLPPEDQLSAELGVSRTTLRTALGNLETMGYIRRIHGAGTFVSTRGPVIVTRLDTLETFHPQLASRMGLPSRLTDVAILSLEADEEIAHHMGLEPGTLVTSVTRTVNIDDRPIAYLCDYIPTTVATHAQLQAGFVDTLIDFFDGREDRPKIEWASSELAALRATRQLSEVLCVAQDDVLLALEEAFFSPTGDLVSWSRNIIVPEYFRFQIGRRVVLRGGRTEPECPPP
jgi:GntR family transcriptional regulator